MRRSLSSSPPASVADGDATCQVTSTSCTDATTLNGKLYTYSVFAIDRAGNTSLAGASSAVTARDQLGPVQPSGLAATPGDASVALRWTAAGADDDVAGYVLVAKPGSQAPTSDTDGTRVCAAIVATSTACTATGLTNGATYTFGLFALDEALNRSQPATVSAAPNGKVSDTKAPAAITKLKAKVSGHKVTLTWANPGDKDFDHVEITAGARKPAALKASKRVYSGKGTKTGITLAPGQSRWFVVVAYDAVGNASPPASVHVSHRAREPVRARAARQGARQGQAQLAGRQGRQVLQRAALRRQEADLRELAQRPRAAGAPRQAQARHEVHLVRLARARREGEGPLRQIARQEHLHVRWVSKAPRGTPRTGGLRGV